MTAEILAATEHLVLRRMTNDDAAALAAYRSDPVQARYQSWETPDPSRAHRCRTRRPQDFANCGHRVGTGPEPQDQRSSGTLLTWGFIGGAGGARTHDPGIMSPML